MKYCRKIDGSYLRQHGGIESEIVDLLQGRVPRTVLARHYFTPSLDYRERVLSVLDKLKKMYSHCSGVSVSLQYLSKPEGVIYGMRYVPPNVGCTGKNEHQIPSAPVGPLLSSV